MSRIFSWLSTHSAKCLIVLLLLLPAIGSVWQGKHTTQENRNLAQWPASPQNWAQFVQYPRKMEQWMNDHLGLRESLIGLNNRIRYRLFRQFPTSQVMQGKNGRVFLVSHSRDTADYLAVQDLCGYQFKRMPMLVDQLNLFGNTMQKQQLDAYLMLMPSAPVTYIEELPDWLAARCNAQPIPLQLAVQDPKVGFKERVFYIREPLLQAKAKESIFPKTWFHWGNAGPRIASELTMQRFWKVDPASGIPLKTERKQLPSDIANLFPGLRLNSEVDEIHFAASGIQACHGPDCFPELGPIGGKLWGINRFRNPQAARPRLMLISDSFGINLAPWYARYYQDVVQIASNDFPRLSPAELAQLKAFMFQRNTPQDLLFAYHDGTVQGGNRITSDLQILFGAPTP